MRSPDRGSMLADLSDAINELTEVRNHSEVIEVEQRDGTSRRRVRRRVIRTFPSLLDELTAAMRPGADGDATAAGFESRPAAELEPINVMTMITDESTTYAKAFHVDITTLKGTLHHLVGAVHTDTQLANLLKDARYWVKRARIATGWDESPITLNQPCPYCWRKHTLVITSDLQAAKCTRCNSEWDDMTIGLLGQMLTTNAEVETMAAATCDSLHGDRNCQRLDGHIYEHRDAAGRYWYNSPNGLTYSSVADETMTA